MANSAPPARPPPSPPPSPPPPDAPGHHAGGPDDAEASPATHHASRALGWMAERRARVRYGLALLAGLVAALAWPPLGWAPLLWVSLPVLAIALSVARTGWQAAITGWCFAFGYMALGLYWVAASMLVDPAFAWMIPFTVLGLPGGMALFHGLAAWVWWRGFRHARPIGGLIALAALWSLAEWLRGHMPAAFPWQIIGYVWVDWIPVIQTASLVGIYGLSLITLVAGLLPAALALDARRPRAAFASALPIAAIGALPIAAIGALALWGGLRLPGDAATVDGVRLRLVQPAIAQADKWNPDLWPTHFRLLGDLSTSPPAEGGAMPTHIIWPETSIPYFLSTAANARAALGALAPPGGALLTGAPRREELADGSRLFHNALMAVGPDGNILAHYDKHNLVPFGEYVPLRSVLPAFVTSIAARGTDYSPGPGPRTLDLPGLPPVGPSICYEAIFPGEVVRRDQRPGWILNITNDAWFGHTAGPHQHFAIARARAVEEGLPLVRAAGTGISAVVDAHGRVLARLDLGERGVLDADLPVALAPTLYTRIGDIGLGVMLALCLGIGAIARRRREVARHA